MALRCLLHVHTHCSFDSVLSPRTIVSRARKLGVDALAVTDHDTIRGSEETASVAAGNPRFVIKAAEYKTEQGDIIGLFLKEEISSRKSNELIKEIHAQGGLVVLPHPYKGHRLDDDLLDQIDLIETYNARCSSSQNHSALELAHKWKKPQIGGSDAHCAGEISAVLTEFQTDAVSSENGLARVLLAAPRQIIAQPISQVYQPYSQIIKAFKTRNAILLAYQLKCLFEVCSEELLSP